MANLPPEIWKEIVDSFSDNHSLRSLLLVNKSFSSLAVRKLYVRVVIGSSAQFNKFADTIAALNNKGYYDYTTFVRAITINTFKREASFPWFRLPSIFALCENVDGLLIGPTEQYADRQTVSVLEDMPSVTLVTRCLAIIIEMLASRSIRRLCLRSLRFLAEFQRNGVHFSAALGKLRDLQSLELWHESGRPLGDGGKKCIVQLVQMNDLKELHLDTFVTDELELDNALTIFENSPNLESLTWWGTHFNKDDEDYLYRTIFKECTKLHKLIVEVSGFQEGDDFLRLSRHSQGLEELTTWCDIGIGALPLSTFMTFIIRNASTLKHVNALISLAGPPVNRRVRNNNSNRNTFERESESEEEDEEEEDEEGEYDDEVLHNLSSFYHPNHTDSYAEWVQSLFEIFQETNREWNINYDTSVSLSHTRFSLVLNEYRQDIEKNWQTLIDKHVGQVVSNICQNIDRLKIFLTFW